MSDVQDAIFRIASVSQLTEQDLEDMRACNEIELAALMRGYERDGKVADHNAWTDVIAPILEKFVEFAPLAGLIIDVATKV